MEFMLCAVLLAADEPSDWYFFASGYSETGELSIDGVGDVVETDAEIGLRIGVGKALNEKFDLEFEFGTNEFNYSTFTAVGDFSYTHYSAMIGYKIPVSESFTVVPKVGFGLTNWELDEFDVNIGRTVVSANDVTAKFGINAEYQIDESITAHVGYRVENTPFEIFGIDGDFGSSGLTFGASFSF